MIMESQRPFFPSFPHSPPPLPAFRARPLTQSATPEAFRARRQVRQRPPLQRQHFPLLPLIQPLRFLPNLHPILPALPPTHPAPAPAALARLLMSVPVLLLLHLLPLVPLLLLQLLFLPNSLLCRKAFPFLPGVPLPRPARQQVQYLKSCYQHQNQ